MCCVLSVFNCLLLCVYMVCFGLVVVVVVSMVFVLFVLFVSFVVRCFDAVCC